MLNQTKIPNDLPIIARPADKIFIDAKIMRDLIEASKSNAFDLIGVHMLPDAAKELLSINTENRPLTDSNVERIIGQIEAKNWGVSNDMLVVSSGGNPRLLNGQNRCTGCSQSGEPILVDIRFGADPKTFLRMDKGKKRSAADDLFVYSSQRGHEFIASNATIAAQAARFLLAYFTQDCNFHFRSSSEEIIKASYEHFSPVLDFVEDARQMASRWGGSIFQYAAVRLLLERSSPRDAQEYWRAICDEDGIEKGSPEQRVVRRFYHIKGNHTRYERSACLIVGFNWKLGIKPTGNNLIIEYPRHTPKLYPRVHKPDGSYLTLEDFPKLTRPKVTAA
jgi:hypothetical protein